MQVDPVKPKLKPPRIKRLKLKFGYVLHSTSAFKFNLRRYSEAQTSGILVGRCRFTVSKRVVKAQMVSALETVM